MPTCHHAKTYHKHAKGSCHCLFKEKLNLQDKKKTRGHIKETKFPPQLRSCAPQKDGGAWSRLRRPSGDAVAAACKCCLHSNALTFGVFFSFVPSLLRFSSATKCATNSTGHRRSMERRRRTMWQPESHAGSHSNSHSGWGGAAQDSLLSSSSLTSSLPASIHWLASKLYASLQVRVPFGQC